MHLLLMKSMLKSVFMEILQKTLFEILMCTKLTKKIHIKCIIKRQDDYSWHVA